MTSEVTFFGNVIYSLKLFMLVYQTWSAVEAGTETCNNASTGRHWYIPGPQTCSGQVYPIPTTYQGF